MSTSEEGPSVCPDLSKVHEPLGALFAPVKDPEGWRQFRLTQDQVDRFWQDGYLTNIQVLSNQQCDKILLDYQRLVNEADSFPGIDMMYEFHSNQSKDPGNVLLHCLGHWRLTPSFHDVCFLPAIAVPASQLLDPKKERKVRLWHDQLFAKPPLQGGNVAWHQDFSYWTRTTPMAHLTVHMALDSQTLDNGGLHYIPGSHRWTRHGGPLPVTDFDFKDMESIQTILTDEEKANFKPVHANLKKGEASIHHPLTVHGSWANRSEFSRRACVVNYIADGVCSNSEEPLLQGTTKFKKGDKMEGQFHPLVYDPAWSRS
ncbi:phytanoyl-CoA dioxygenase, peroxisomal-like [Asterias rubens]|uniref:phytanoyl-CoA dioxygenase, peroxisomal-like n=1 Tax=Asterias rubens TaxID=7604 RepID=UPI001455B17B|nr:phytanoyl-CoA dioxygenase, peroxisomal-like [Asterias rubens]